MLYEDYQKKIKKIARTLSKLVKLSPLIIGAVVLICAGAIALMVAKGNVSDFECRSEVVYGESLDCKASAFLGGIDFEFSSDGNTWSEGVPIVKGSYQVRAKSYDILGRPRYSEAKSVIISARSSDLTVAGNSVVYGDIPSLQADVQYEDYIKCDAFDFSDDIALKTVITPKGESIRVFNKNGEDVSDCYSFNVLSKEVSVIPRPIVITIEDHSEVYSGKEISWNEYQTSEGGLKEGDIVHAFFDLVMTDVGERENNATFTFVNKDGIEISYLYDLTVISGKLTVEKRPLDITTHGFEKVYDGKEISVTEYTVSEGTSVAEGHRILPEGAGTYKNVGEYSNTMSIRILDEKGQDVTQNYSVSLSFGVIDISKRALSVSTKNDSWVYDGSYHNNTLLSHSGEVSGHLVRVIGEVAEIRNVGKTENRMLVCVVDENKQDVTQNYDISYSYGELTVTKRPLSITTPDSVWVYDGKIHYANDPIVIGLANGDDLFPEKRVSEKNAGEYENTIGNYTILNASGDNQIENYDITHEFGTLTIKKRAIVVKPVDISAIYDGKVKAPESFEVASSSAYKLVSGHKIEGKASGERRDVGSQITRVTEVSIKEGREDVTKNYDIKIEEGSIVISKRTVIITTSSMHWTYDGNDHHHHGYNTVSTLKFADGDVLKVEESSYVNEVGEGKVKNVFYKYCVETNDDEARDVTHNYDLEVRNEGYIWIDKRDILITLEDKSWKYDDTVHSSYDPVIGLDGLAQGQKINVSDYPTITDVGVIDNYITYKIIKTDPLPYENADKTENYNIVEDFGYIEITPRILKIVLPDKTWTYDAEEHYFIDYKFASDGDVPVNGHSFIINDYPKIVDAGRTQNFLDVSIIKLNPINGENPDKTSNYVIDDSGIGKLIVSKKYIKIKTGMLITTYDGQPHSTKEYTIAGGGLVKNQKLVILSSTVVEDHTPQSINNEFVIEIVDDDGVDRSYNYDVQYEYGVLYINKRSLQVYSKSQSWLYDGREHSYATLSKNSASGGVEVYGLADGQSAVVDTFTTITDAGSTTNKVSVKVFKDEPRPDEKAEKTENYDIQYSFGTLTVNKRSLIIQIGSLVSTYTGKPQSCTEYEIVTGNGFAPNQTLVIVKSTEVENYTPEPVNNEFFEFQIVDLEGVDRKDNYIVGFRSGKITINKASLAVQTESITWLYDGIEHSHKELGFGLKVNGVVEDQAAYVDTFATITDAGECKNVVTVRIHKVDPITGNKGEETTENYAIFYDYGTLTVDKRRIIVVTETNHNTIYDGQPHYFRNHTDLEDGLAPNQRLVVSESTTITYVTDGVVENVFTKYDIVDANGVSRLYNYELTFEHGTISIQKRPVILITNSDSKIFDGDPLTCKKYSVSGSSPYDFVVGERFEIYESSSVTYVTEGKVDNVFLSMGVIDGKGVDRYANYDIQFEYYGVLEIIPRPITVYSGSAEKLYDGDPLTNAECGISGGMGLVKDHKLIIATKGSQLLPGTSKNTLSYSVVTGDGDEMTENYVFTEELGTLAVIKRTVTVTVAALSREYNGKALSVGPGYYMVAGDDLMINVISLNIAQTEVGYITVNKLNENPENFISFVAYLDVNGETRDVTIGCDVKFVSFKDNVVEVTKKHITITANSVTVEYNKDRPSLEADPNGYTLTVGPLAAGHTIKATVSGSITGNPEEKVSGECLIDEDSVKIVDSNGNDMTENYDVTCVAGVLTIIPTDEE